MASPARSAVRLCAAGCGHFVDDETPTCPSCQHDASDLNIVARPPKPVLAASFRRDANHVGHMAIIRRRIEWLQLRAAEKPEWKTTHDVREAAALSYVISLLDEVGQ